jgi:poly(3-hydroxybutyrate) depolymerase
MNTLIRLVLLIATLAFGLFSRTARAQSPAPEAPKVPAWITAEVKAPRVSFHTFDSAAAKAKVSYHLYTPAAYERDAEARFPVVYWLHGSGGGAAGIAQLAKFVDGAIEAGKTKPFLIVFVHGLPQGMYVDWKDSSTPIESMIVKDLVPHIDATLRTIAARDGRMLDGFSMGGYGAARLGFKFPEIFRAVSMLGAGPLDPDFERTPRANPHSRDGLLERVYGDRAYFRELSPWELAARNADAIKKDTQLRIAVGDRDGTFALNKEFHEHLETLKIPHEWTPLEGVEHDPMKTLEALGDRHWAFYRKAFGEPAAKVARRDGEIKVKVKDAERAAIVVNAPPVGELRAAVVILHGGMGSAEQMRTTSGFDAVARAEGFMAVYAQGTDFGTGRRAWNTGHLLRRQVRDADDIAYLDALIDALVRDHGADPARIFMTGGSNGGMMTYVYAVARAERLAGIAPVVASMFTFEKSPAVPLPILIINGGKGNEVPLAGGMSENPLVRNAQSTPYKPVREVVDFWVKANKSTPEGKSTTRGSVTTTTYPAQEGGAVTEFVVDSEGGHGWPGTRSRREENAPIASFKGAERVWEFFKDKSRAKEPMRAKPTARLEVEILEFPALTDASRGSGDTATEPARRRLLPRREQDASDSARKVPIKVHVPATGGPYPVIVVSHGAGGDWDTHFAQAQDLATNGYAVLCVEHVGSNRERLTAGLRPMKNLDAMIRDAGEVLARPRDMSFAIDQAKRWNESHERLRGKLDLARVGAVGHSFGAFTTMVVCGMRPALDWLTPTVAPGKGLGPDLRDPRVKCGVALSPQGVGEPFFVAESFAGLQVPLLGISGTKDDQQAGRPATNRREAFALWPGNGHFFVWLANAKHIDFTDSTGGSGRGLPSATRNDVQRIARPATLAFFDLHLKHVTATRSPISAAALEPLLAGEIDRVEVLSK